MNRETESLGNGKWLQIPVWPETLPVKLRHTGGSLEIWVEDPTAEQPPTLDETLHTLAEGLVLLPQWYVERHGGHLVRVKDVLAMLKLYGEMT